MREKEIEHQLRGPVLMALGALIQYASIVVVTRALGGVEDYGSLFVVAFSMFVVGVGLVVAVARNNPKARVAVFVAPVSGALAALVVYAVMMWLVSSEDAAACLYAAVFVTAYAFVYAMNDRAARAAKKSV